MIDERQHFTTPEPLAEAMAQLERRLETPIVPGELSAWSVSATEAFDQAMPRVGEHIAKDHAEQLKAIRDQDAKLAHRVSQLVDEDGRILTEFTALHHALGEVARKCQEPPVAKSGPAYDTGRELADRGLELIVAFRKQEAAVATWFVEAFQRDRGSVD